MSRVKSIQVQNIRSHGVYTLTPNENVTVITGKNGSGKTTLLEAIYSGLRGTSFKGSDKEMLQNGSTWWRVDITFGDDQRVIKFDPSRQTGKKQFIVDEKTTYRLPMKSKFPVILFEPDDLRLINGSPARRRKFIDTLIGQLDPLYGASLRKYERGLKQRNNLLKTALKTGIVNQDELFAWDVLLADNGAYLISQRLQYSTLLANDIQGLYKAISGTDDTVTLSYSQVYLKDIKQTLLNELHASRQKDMYTGNTSVGPHRHDIIFSLNNTPAAAVASRGETRTIILALKFLEVFLTEDHTNKKPIILLDDVFSELDPGRQKLLTEYLKDYQIIITSATSFADTRFLHVEL